MKNCFSEVPYFTYLLKNLALRWLALHPPLALVCIIGYFRSNRKFCTNDLCFCDDGDLGSHVRNSFRKNNVIVSADWRSFWMELCQHRYFFRRTFRKSAIHWQWRTSIGRSFIPNGFPFSAFYGTVNYLLVSQVAVKKAKTACFHRTTANTGFTISWQTKLPSPANRYLIEIIG